MIRETVQLWLAEGADAGALESALKHRLNEVAVFHHLGRNMEGTYGGGDYTLDLAWKDEANRDALAGVPGLERLDRLSYCTLGQGSRSAGEENIIWRTLLLRVKPGSDAAAVEQFERDLLAMPDYMQGIRRWALNRVSSESRWTHVWQQEYQQLGDLMGEYLLHPYHWGWVDHYFDADFPDCLVDSQISHSFCPLQGSVIAETSVSIQ